MNGGPRFAVVAVGLGAYRVFELIAFHGTVPVYGHAGHGEPTTLDVAITVAARRNAEALHA